LHGKKSGVDWSKFGSDPEVRKAVMRSPGFAEFLQHIIQDIEKNKHAIIGVNCRKGQHRSSTAAHLVKHCFYPGSKIVFLEPRSKEQHRFEW
jgi:RNase adaptor protein for sRNA GlmZ degradation